jgi:hypothetical protein
VRCLLLLLLLDGHGSLLGCGILLLLLRIQVDCTRDLRPATNREEQGEKKKKLCPSLLFFYRKRAGRGIRRAKNRTPPPTKEKKKKSRNQIKRKKKKLEGYDLIYVRLFMGCWMAKWKGGTTTNPTVVTSSPLVGHS